MGYLVTQRARSSFYRERSKGLELLSPRLLVRVTTQPDCRRTLRWQSRLFNPRCSPNSQYSQQLWELIKHSFHKHLLRAYSVPDTVLSSDTVIAGDTAMNKTFKTSCPCAVHMPVGGDNEQINNKHTHKIKKRVNYINMGKVIRTLEENKAGKAIIRWGVLEF